MKESSLTIGVVVFPGTNCDQDIVEALEVNVPQAKVLRLWHDHLPLEPLSLHLQGLILPGGFSYGDYLRCGAIAKQSKLMHAIQDFSQDGGVIIGICNGFQILTEAGLLEGALIQNKNRRFICQQRTRLSVVSTQSPLMQGYTAGQVIEMPIAHGEGCYLADASTLERLEANGQVAFRYEEDVNGSLNGIAGITNEKGNVLGLMPHPERNLLPQLLGGFTGEGRPFFQALAKELKPLA
ncbi:MAG: phosphoribosylformylglycinamidine synthase subunit PurQ [Vampirovibrio sp.]